MVVFRFVHELDKFIKLVDYSDKFSMPLDGLDKFNYTIGEKSLATPDCFFPYLVNDAAKACRSIGLECLVMWLISMPVIKV